MRSKEDIITLIRIYFSKICVAITLALGYLAFVFGTLVLVALLKQFFIAILEELQMINLIGVIRIVLGTVLLIVSGFVILDILNLKKTKLFIKLNEFIARHK